MVWWTSALVTKVSSWWIKEFKILVKGWGFKTDWLLTVSTSGSSGDSISSSQSSSSTESNLIRQGTIFWDIVLSASDLNKS